MNGWPLMQFEGPPPPSKPHGCIWAVSRLSGFSKNSNKAAVPRTTTKQKSRLRWYPTMKEDGFDALMHDAWVFWGLCDCIKHGEQLHVTQFIPSEGPVHVALFVEGLLLADDVNPNLAMYERHKTVPSVSFTNYMGGDVVEPKFAWPFSLTERLG